MVNNLVNFARIEERGNEPIGHRRLLFPAAGADR